MKKLTLAASAAAISFLPFLATAQPELDSEFDDFLQSVRDCYYDVEAMPSDTREQVGDRFEKSLSCDDGAEMYAFNHVYRQAKAIKYAVSEVEYALEVLKEMKPYANDLEELEAVTRELRKASNALFLIGYLN